MSRFGRSRLYDEDDEDDSSSFGYTNNASGGKNPFDDDADDSLLRMRTQIANHEDACLESTKRALASIADSEQTGIATAEELMQQREQLARVDQRLDDTQAALKSTQRHINSIKSVWGGFTNMFRKKETLLPPTSPVKPNPPSSQSRLQTVVNNLDTDIDRVRTNRGTDVSGFYDDSKALTRSSTTSSGLSGGSQTKSARMVEVDENLDLMSEGLGRLKNLAVGLNQEIESQNELLDRINDKVMDTDDSLWHQQKQIKRILK